MSRIKSLLTYSVTILLCASGGAFLAYTFSQVAHSSGQIIDQARKLEVNSPLGVPFWQSVIANRGGEQAYKIFGEAYGDDGKNQQHAMAHLFGEALYKELGIDGIVVCDDSYSFGCYHAFFGWALVDKGLDIITELDQACIDIYGEMGLGCQHGIGHGISAEMGNERLNEALEACMKLQWKGPLGGCTSGVFMEFNFSTMNGFSNRELDERGLHYPCNVVNDRFVSACYFEQPSWWSRLEDMDNPSLGELCGEVKVKKGRVSCFRGIGNLVAGKSFDGISEIPKYCEPMATEEGRFHCLEGALWFLANEPQFKDVWRELCIPYKDTEYYERCIKSKDLI